MQKNHILLLFLIITIAAVFRFTGLNWDQNQHLHPDERFLTMVATSLKWPASLAEYFDTDRSPLNPHNQGFNFYVYGTWPVVLAKAAAQVFGRDTYDGFPLVGRTLAALADLATVLVVYLIGKTVVKSTRVGLLAAFLYATSVLPIQLSHFFTPDPFAVLFATIAILFMMRDSLGIPLGVAVGLALAAKISAIFLLPLVVITFGIRLLGGKNLKTTIRGVLLFIFSGVLTLYLLYPTLFEGIGLNPEVLANWRELKAFDNPATTFPPPLQWVPTGSWYLLIHTVFWGLGLPAAILVLAGIIYVLALIIQRKSLSNQKLYLLLFWVGLLGVYQSNQFAKALRYLYPIYPSLAVLTGIFVAHAINQKPARLKLIFLASGAILYLWWIMGVTSVYRQPHTRVAASDWIYAHIPAGATLANEAWDDGLPLSLAGYSPSLYQHVQLPLYDPDTTEKWQKITSLLASADYVLITSNRLWRSLSALPNRYPITTQYYQKLFSGELGFQQAAVFTSYPCLLPRLSNLSYLTNPATNLHPPPISLTATADCYLALNDDGAEESFTVYDHPKVIIFSKLEDLSPNELYRRITADG